MEGVDTRHLWGRLADGSKYDATLVDVRVPVTLPGVAPCAAPHELTVIVDTSSPTSCPAEGGGNVLEASKALLHALLRALPQHIEVMRAKGALNASPVLLTP